MIRAETSGGILTLTLDRPEKANALIAEMLAELADAVAESDTRVLILTGAGKVFSAGADLDAMRGGLATAPEWERLSGAIAAFEGLSIAALNGTVAGGAMGMVLACDLRVAVPTARAFYPVMKLGYLPQPSDPGRLAALVGAARAKLILMGGAKISADEALAIGLFDRLAEDPVAAARDLAADVLAADTTHAVAIKQMIRRP